MNTQRRLSKSGLLSAAIRTLALFLLFVVAASLLLTGCGGESPGTTGGGAATTAGGGGVTTTGGAGAGGAAAMVQMNGFKFVPQDVTVKVGDTVTWTNEDSAQHDVVANDGLFKSDLLGQGETFSFTFSTAGSFPYICSIHPQMKGTITVEQ